MPGQLRSDLWCAAFVRRYNDLGHFCVVERKGDAIAGQVFVAVDHLDGTCSLFTPTPSVVAADSADRLFTRRLSRVERAKVSERIAREIDFDPDLWVLALDLRGEPDLRIVA